MIQQLISVLLRPGGRTSYISSAGMHAAVEGLVCCHAGILNVMSMLQAVQHTWTYKPLVQDVLGMTGNRVTLDAEPSTSQQILQQNATSKKTYEVWPFCRLTMPQ